VIASLGLGLGLLVFASSGRAAAASPPADPEDAKPIELRLEIDTSLAGSGTEVLHRRIEERANIVLRHAKVLAGDSDDLLVRIIVTELDADNPGYAVTFTMTASNGSAAGKPIQVTCSLCTETELVARVEAELEPLIPTLRELSQSEPTSIPADGEDPVEPDDEPIGLQPDPGPERTDHGAGNGQHRKLLTGGAWMLAVGGSSLIAGVALAIPKPKVDRDNPLELITTRPVGYALIGTGVALATVGTVLTALAIERRRKAGRVADLSVAPLASFDSAGIVFGGRF
jgi:hypothetical protein